MPLSIPTAPRSLKIELTADQVAALETIATRHYDRHAEAYQAAKAEKRSAAEVAASLLEDAILRELRPPRSKKANGS
jgi:hypothetical protein